MLTFKKRVFAFKTLQKISHVTATTTTCGQKASALLCFDIKIALLFCVPTSSNVLQQDFLEKNTILLYVRNKCFRNLFDLNSIPNGMLRHSLATLEGEYDFVAFLSKIVDEP